MAGRFSVLTWVQEPRCSRQARPALAAWPQGSLSSAIAVPHSDSRRRNAAASVVLASFASRSALTDANFGAGGAVGGGTIAATGVAGCMAAALFGARAALSKGP